MNMTFYITHNREMGLPYSMALKKRGFIETENAREADFVILDHNWQDGYRNALPLMEHCRQNGKPIFMIPHGVRGWMFWDIVYEVNNNITAMFVPARGHKLVLKEGNFPAPIEETGFPWAKIEPWTSKPLRNVLFAPIHPELDGTYRYSPLWPRYNAMAWRKLQQLKHKFKLTIYHSGSIENNRLNLDPDVHYVESDLSLKGAIEQIDRADLVIAQETFASLALARGKTVFMLNDRTLVSFYTKKTSVYWPYYEKNHVYPLNFLAISPRTLYHEMLEAMATESPEVYRWKKNFIGDNFDEHSFVKQIAFYLLIHRPNGVKNESI